MISMSVVLVSMSEGGQRVAFSNSSCLQIKKISYANQNEYYHLRKWIELARFPSDKSGKTEWKV